MTTYNESIPYNSHISYNGLPPIVTATELPSLELRVTSKAGVVSALPEAIVDSMSFESNGPSAIELSVSQGTVGYEQTDDYSVVELLMNGAIIEDGRWLLRNKGWNEATLNDTKKFSGKSFLWDRFAKTVVWTNKKYTYSNKTPGFVLNDLFQEAKNRGALGASLTWNFTNAVDSIGNAWPSVITYEFKMGMEYDKIVTQFIEAGLIDISLLGNEIRVFVSGKRGVAKPAVMVVGQDITDAPQQSSAEGIVSDLLVVGDEDQWVTRSRPLTSTIWGREEGFLSQGGTQDPGVLSMAGEVALTAGNNPRIQRTYNMVIHQDRQYLPLRDYQVCDYIMVEHGDANLINLRILQLVLKRSKGQWTGSLVLNDKFLDNDVKLKNRIDGILSGTSIVASARTSTSDDLKDTSKPLPPSNIQVQTESYLDGQGRLRVIAFFSWDPITANTDGSVATDIQYYSLRWRYSNEDPNKTRYVWSDDTTMTIDNLDPNRDIVFFMYANDNSRNFSAHTIDFTFRTAKDTIPPGIPSSPLLVSRAKQVTISWDGLDNAGQPMPADFRHIEIWSSHFDGFDVEDGNCYLEGTMSHRGDMVVSAWGYTIGEKIYVRFRAVDQSGNKSSASVINNNTVQGVAGSDLNANSVNANAIGAGVIGTIHMNAMSVETSRLTLGPTMNLVQDPAFNNAEMRAQRLTTRWSDRPAFWFFKNTPDFNVRNGYHLQALSTPAGENGGRMYVVDWINVQYGETYYFGVFARDGDFTPHADARLFMGVEVTKADGSIAVDGITIDTTNTWTKYGFNMPVGDLTWVKMRFFVRADNLTSGDIIMDDWEVRSAVGTTAVAGPRVTVTPLGVEMFNASEIQTIWMSAATGDVTIRGQFISSSEGRRIELNPGATYLPEIRFYGLEGEAYAYINASAGISDFPFLGVNGPDVLVGAELEGQTLLLYDDGFQLGYTRKSTGNLVGPGILTYGGILASYISHYGKIPWGGSGLSSFQAIIQQAVLGGGPQATIILAMPPTASDGVWYPLYSVWRASLVGFTHHISAKSAANFNITLNAISGNLVSTNSLFHQFYVRGD